MTVRDLIIEEMATVPEPILAEVLDFLRFLKVTRLPSSRDLKRQAGKRWVNADGRYGFWQYEMCGLKEVSQLLDEAFANSQ